MFPIRKPLYKRCGGRTVKWNKPAIIPKTPAAMWCEAIPPGLYGSKPSGPQAGETG